MSQENVEVVRASIDAWNSGDMERAVREFFAPDAIARMPQDWPEPGPFVGQEAIIRQGTRMREAWDADSVQQLSDFIDIADHVIVRLAWQVAGRGPIADMEFTLMWTVRNERIIAVEYFWDHADVLEAVGLSEQAMSEENAEVVWRAVEAFNRGGTEAALPWLAPDVEWHDLPDLPDAEIYRGHGGFLAAFRQFFGELEDYTVKVDETTDHGERVLVFARIIGRGRGSGAWFEQRIFGVWTVRNRLVVRAVWFRTREEALEAVRLSEQDAHVDS